MSSYRYSKMTKAQIGEFLQARRFAIVGTNRSIGPPQLTPVWYLYENGLAYLSFGKDSIKCRNLERDPRIALCIAGHCPDARSVMIYGTAELVPDSRQRGSVAWRLVRRYYDSDDEARAYIKSLGDVESVLAIVTPSRMLGEDYN